MGLPLASSPQAAKAQDGSGFNGIGEIGRRDGSVASTEDPRDEGTIERPDPCNEQAASVKGGTAKTRAQSAARTLRLSAPADRARSNNLEVDRCVGRSPTLLIFIEHHYRIYADGHGRNDEVDGEGAVPGRHVGAREFCR
jgi:hypothetical protein